MSTPFPYDKAACAGINRDHFFPVGKGGRKPKGTTRSRLINGNTEDLERTAAKTCRKLNCPVISECLSFAIENNEQGVWGATSTGQRHDIMRRYNIGPFKSVKG